MRASVHACGQAGVLGRGHRWASCRACCHASRRLLPRVACLSHAPTPLPKHLRMLVTVHGTHAKHSCPPCLPALSFIHLLGTHPPTCAPTTCLIPPPATTHPLPSNPLPAATHPLAHPLTTPLIPLCAATQRHLYSEKMRFDQGRFENADAPVSPFGSKFAEGGDTGLGGYRWDRSTAHMSKAGYPFESCACLCTAWIFTAGASQRVFSSCTCVSQQRQAPLNASLRAGPLRCCTRLSLHLSHAPASASSPPPAAPAAALPCSQTARCQRPATTPTAPRSPWASTSSQRSWRTPRWVGGHWAGGGMITRLTGRRRPKLLYWNECV